MTDCSDICYECASPDSFVPLVQMLAQVLTPGDVLLLRGELGAGKTTFTQYLAQALEVGAEQYVSSPSFALLHEYQGQWPVFHMDLYRLTGEDDVEAAGLAEYLQADGIVIIEWPDRLEGLTPPEYLDISLRIQENGSRLVCFCPIGASWQYRFPLG